MRKKRTLFKELHILPYLIAERVCATPYEGKEWSPQHRGDPSGTEALLKQMTPAQIKEFAALCDKRCELAYENNTAWFDKCVKSDSPGQLYMWVSHWLQSYLHNPSTFKRRIVAQVEFDSKPRRLDAPLQ